METFDKIFGAIFMIGLALSAVGLLVGGVGVVAIMMISVTERTREIGVRKALGATKGTILWQFLVEAATLTSIGAVIGLIGGAAVATLMKQFSPIPASVPGQAILAALVGSAVTNSLRHDARSTCRATRSRGSAALRVVARETRESPGRRVRIDGGLDAPSSPAPDPNPCRSSRPFASP